MVFETEEKRAGSGAKNVVGGNVGVFPRERADVVEDGIAFLAGRYENGRGGIASGERLGFGLLDLRRGGRCGCCGDSGTR